MDHLEFRKHPTLESWNHHKGCLRTVFWDLHNLANPNDAIEGIEAVLLHSSKGRFSSHIFTGAILRFYAAKKLFPAGIVKEMECIQKWSLRMGLALQRLVPLLG